jgi:hypothetical protein
MTSTVNVVYFLNYDIQSILPSCFSTIVILVSCMYNVACYLNSGIITCSVPDCILIMLLYLPENISEILRVMLYDVITVFCRKSNQAI